MTGRVYILTYFMGSFLTDGAYADAESAMRASDVDRWYPTDSGFRSEDGRTLIESDLPAAAVAMRDLAGKIFANEGRLRA